MVGQQFLSYQSGAYKLTTASQVGGTAKANLIAALNTSGVFDSSMIPTLNYFPVNNVKNFGATGNGTTDDSSAIQSAITYAANNGGTIIVPDGNYLIASAISSSANNLYMLGQSQNAIFIRGSSFTGTLFNFSGANTVIENIVINGMGGTVTNSAAELINNGNGAITRLVSVTNSYNIGINIDGNNTTADQCSVTGLGTTQTAVQAGSGIYAGTASYVNKKIVKCTLVNTGIEGISIGGTGYIVDQCYFSGCHNYTAGAGSQLATYDSGNVTKGIISNCIFAAGGSIYSGGIELVGYGSNVFNCIFINQKSYGISFDSGSGYIIANNEFLNCGSGNSGTTNLGLGCGVDLSPGVTDVKIHGNRFIDNQSTPTMTCAVLIQNTAGTNTTIVNNTIEGISSASGTGPIVNQGTALNLVIANNLGIDNIIPTIASAATLALTYNSTIIVSGTTNITAISGPTWTNRCVTIIPTGVFTITLGNTLTTTANTPFNIIYNGSTWYIY